MLQDVWLRIHRARHTYRQSEPLAPWVYVIAHRVRIDKYRKRQRSASRETGADMLRDRPSHYKENGNLPTFDDLMAALPESQREVLTMLKVNDLSVEEIARATSSTVGAVKQKAHRAYKRLRDLWRHKSHGFGNEHNVVAISGLVLRWRMRRIGSYVKVI
jgi:RNA polymerase sigma-70 factor (ECF subfamily)